MSAFVFGILLRRYPSKIFAGQITMIMHLIIIAVVISIVIGFISPGLTHYDKLLGIPSLPSFGIISLISWCLGEVMFMIGISLLFFTQVLLLVSGGGLPLFGLTEKLTDSFLYKYTRNPMMLGLYLLLIALGLLTRSTYFILWTLLALIPANVFFLNYFEEKELENRFGQSYIEYKQQVPFLIPSFRKLSRVEKTNT